MKEFYLSIKGPNIIEGLLGFETDFVGLIVIVQEIWLPIDACPQMRMKDDHI
jgi:hypothetical protein